MTSVGALIASILADSDALEPRLILADLLAERGDPRGEFIGLQCLERTTDLQRRRMMALLRQHWLAWVGSPLALLVDNRTVRFQKGFLHSCTLRRSPVWLQEEVEILPEHALVRRVDVVREFVPEEASLTRVLPRLSGLRAVHGINHEELAALVEQPRDLCELGIVDLDRSSMSALLHATLPALEFLSLEARDRTELVVTLLERLPTVSRIRVGFGDLRAWRESLLGRGLDAIEVRVQGWLLVLSGQKLDHLDAWPIAELREDPTRPLVAELSRLEIRTLSYIRVRGGMSPGEEAVGGLKRAARGTPLRLPASWSRKPEV